MLITLTDRHIDNGQMRHPGFLGLREDNNLIDVVFQIGAYPPT